jgi:hypothetical protein
MLLKNFPGSLIALLLFFAIVTTGCGTEDYEDKMRRNSSVTLLSPSPVIGSEPG